MSRLIASDRRRDRRRMRPNLMALEDRQLLSTIPIVVNNPTDSPVAGQTDLRQAIAAANSTVGASTITFDSTVFNIPRTITLAPAPNDGNQFKLTNPATTTITGPGANLLSISGGGTSRVFYLHGGSAALSGLTITGGHADRGGGLANTGGTLTLTNFTISGNSAFVNAGGLYNVDGAMTTLTNCTVSGNSASDGGGGVFIYNGNVSLTNCTVSGNSADFGGGLLNFGTLTLTNCTVSGNTDAGLFSFYGRTTATNTIIAGNQLRRVRRAECGEQPTISSAATRCSLPWVTTAARARRWLSCPAARPSTPGPAAPASPPPTSAA